jgi:hypothetical protein
MGAPTWSSTGPAGDPIEIAAHGFRPAAHRTASSDYGLSTDRQNETTVASKSDRPMPAVNESRPLYIAHRATTGE